MTISLLAAYTKNEHIIGAQGKIPWNLPSERNYFKTICNNKFVIPARMCSILIDGKERLKEIKKEVKECLAKVKKDQ